jgi:hypothetical protein
MKLSPSTPTDGIKAILAGADAIQMVSAILRHGPSFFVTMRDELARWMESIESPSLDEVRGRLSMAGKEAPGAFERAQDVRTLSGWSSWLQYQAYVHSHDARPRRHHEATVQGFSKDFLHGIIESPA